MGIKPCLRLYFLLLFCIPVLLHGQTVSFGGFSLQACGSPLSMSWVLNDYDCGGGGTSNPCHGFQVIRNGTVTLNLYGYQSDQYFGNELFMMNDSTGFVVYKYAGGGMMVQHTSDFGANWVFAGGGPPKYLGFFPVHPSYGYLFAWYPGYGLELYRCAPPSLTAHSTLLHDPVMNHDTHVWDTIPGTVYCPFDSLIATVMVDGLPVEYVIHISHGPVAAETPAAAAHYFLSSAGEDMHLHGDLSRIRAAGLYNVQGQCLRRCATADLPLISTGGLPPGLYLLRLYTVSGPVTLRFLHPG